VHNKDHVLDVIEDGVTDVSGENVVKHGCRHCSARSQHHDLRSIFVLLDSGPRSLVFAPARWCSQRKKR